MRLGSLAMLIRHPGLDNVTIGVITAVLKGRPRAYVFTRFLIDRRLDLTVFAQDVSTGYIRVLEF